MLSRGLGQQKGAGQFCLSDFPMNCKAVPFLMQAYLLISQKNPILADREHRPPFRSPRFRSSLLDTGAFAPHSVASHTT